MEVDDITEAVYQFICDYHKEHGMAPTLREIGIGCFLARGSVVRYVDRLEAWGWIKREPGRARSILPVKKDFLGQL